jgi:alkylhydroperoxidase family enzyme
MTMTLILSISPAVEARLKSRAVAAGLDVETYAAQTLERLVTRPSLDEVLAPLRAEVEASGMTEEQLVQLLEAAKHEMRAERRAPRKVS